MIKNDKIPCLDLKGQHQQVKKEIFEAFEKVYEKTAFSGGPFVQEFEEKFSKYVGSKHAIGVGNGTVSLHLAMLALDIGPGDEVIIPANTFIATAWGVSHAGAKPVFVDCDDTWEIDPLKIEEAITNKTIAVRRYRNKRKIRPKTTRHSTILLGLTNRKPILENVIQSSIS